ncbi:MAG: pantetheine-phosphate adenylyltransferase [Thermodesulfobacteriota bacterium]|nr:pantetheine-phosphate adenylyltransferase [Thermodesulfobacteriota bacterium]
MTNRIAVYPGSFDPVTNGHLDIIQRGLKSFDTVIVAVAKNSAKDSLFTVEERIAMIREATDDDPHVQVDVIEGLLINYVESKGAQVILRGLRAVSDFEYEFQLAQLNRTMHDDIETLFLMTSLRYAYLSSSIVKEIASLHGSIDKFVPKNVQKKLTGKFLKNR